MANRLTPLIAIGLVIIGIVDASLIACLVGSWVDAPATIAATEWRPNVDTDDEAVPTTQPISAYEQVLAHPLFFKTREPFVPPPPPPPRLARPAPLPRSVVEPGITVSGVLISGPIRKAYLTSKSDRDGTWVREGEDYEGWKVKSVTTGVAKLQRDDRLIELPLYPKQ